MGASFNTKDSIHKSKNYSEVDATSSSDNTFFPNYVDGFWNGIVPLPTPINYPSQYSGCDDFWWESEDFYGSTPTPEAEYNFTGIDMPLGHHLSGDYFNPSGIPTSLPYNTPTANINFRPNILWSVFGENPIKKTEDLTFYCQRGNINGFGRGNELEDSLDVYNGMGYYTPTPIPHGNPCAFLGRGNVNAYSIGLNAPPATLYVVTASTEDTTAPGSSRISHLWPFLGISQNNVSYSTPPPSASVNLPQIVANKSALISEQPIPEIIERLDCFESIASQLDNNEPTVELMGGGFNYSNLSTGYYSGTLQFSVILRYSNFDNFDPEEDELPFNAIGIKFMGDEDYEEISLGAFTPAALDGDSDEGYVELSFSYLLLGEYFPSDYMAINLLLLDVEPSGTPTPVGLEWPFLKVIPSTSIKKYISAGVVGQDPDGSYSDPFGSVSEALTWFDTEFNGTIDKEHPVELVMLSGSHEITHKDIITLPAFYELSGESGAIFKLPSAEPLGNYIELGYGSVLRNLTIECGVKCDHSRAYIDNCVFQVPIASVPNPTPTPFGATPIPAISVIGHHDLHVRNCLFTNHELPVQAEDNSLLNVSNCTFADCRGAIRMTDESISRISNCIFYNIRNSSQSATTILADEDAYAYVETSAFYLNDRKFNALNDSEINYDPSNLVYANPCFVNASQNDYHLIQSTVRNSVSPANTSPCVDAGTWNGHISGSTASDQAFDSDKNDIGYHYSAAQQYSFPRFKAEDGANTDYSTEIAIFNPTDYSQSISLTCRNMSGTIQDFNGAADGNILDLQLEAGETWFRTLADSCSIGDDQCIESPCTAGSITVESNGPLFGEYRIIEENATTGTNSWMLPMQRVDLLEDEGAATSLANDSWTGNFGGGSNSIYTELVLHNLDSETNSISGSVYNTQGTPVPSEDFIENLAVGETTTVLFDGMSIMDYSNMEYIADGPVAGEVIFHCQNQSSDHNFSHGEVLQPASQYSDCLTAPFVQLINSGTYYQESYVCLKNPETSSISAYVDIFDESGDSIFYGSPTPTPIIIPAHGSECISSYSFPDWGTYSVEINISDNKKVIGHQELMSYESSESDFGFSGSEVDHHIESPTRFFVPICTQKSNPDESTWIAIRNNTSSSVTVDLEILDLSGNDLDDTTLILDALEILFFTFGDSPALLDPDTEEHFSLSIKSTGNISGWVEHYGINSGGDDQSYDANILQSW